MTTLLVTRPDPGDFRRGRLAWDVLNAAADHGAAIDMIDLSAARMLRPYSIACLAAIGATRPGTALTPPMDGRCQNYLCRVGLGNWFGDVDFAPCEHQTTVVARQLATAPGSFASEVIELLLEAEAAPAGVGPVLENHLDEVILNALTHAESSIGTIVVAQVFPGAGKLEAAVLDLGVTVCGHLGRHPNYRGIPERSLLERATELGVTGTVGLNRWNEPNSGVGLAELRKYCESGRGEMTILSGGYYLTFGADGIVAKRFFKGFRGTLVNIQFSI